MIHWVSDLACPERQPEGPARAYLRVIQREPKAVQKALKAA